MPKTLRLGWEYPQEDAKAWYDLYERLINQQESDILLALEDYNLYLVGGGKVAIDLDTDTVSWTSDFTLVSFGNGGVITIEPGSLNNFVDGSIAYVEVTRPITTTETKTLSIGASTIYAKDRVPLFWRVRDGIIYRQRRAATADFMYWEQARVAASDISASGFWEAYFPVTGGTGEDGNAGHAWYLDISATVGVGPARFRAFKDAARTDLIYDTGSVALPFVDRIGFSFEDVENDRIYFSIENLSAGVARYSTKIKGSYLRSGA